MRNLIAIILIALTMTACSGSRGCGCPSWGMDELSESEWHALAEKFDSPANWVWM